MTTVQPPIAPMLARLAQELPWDGYLYEPKWDGFRAIVFRDGDSVDVRSRHDRPLARYFPELVDAARQLTSRSYVLDGEIIPERGGSFASVMLRLHPSKTRVERLARESPTRFVAFDLLAERGEDLRGHPFIERRMRLERLVPDEGRIVASVLTDDRSVALGWLGNLPRGVDGVVAKDRRLRYLPGKRAMVKVKPLRTADCVVAGMRELVGIPVVGSLLLGLYDGGVLRHIGVASAFSDAARRRLYDELIVLATDLRGHPWERGFALEHSPVGRLAGSAGRWDPTEMPLDWVPLRPERVAEVAYDALDGHRFRHPARFRRWRPDRDPRSCTLEQLS